MRTIITIIAAVVLVLIVCNPRTSIEDFSVNDIEIFSCSPTDPKDPCP